MKIIIFVLLKCTKIICLDACKETCRKYDEIDLQRLQMISNAFPLNLSVLIEIVNFWWIRCCCYWFVDPNGSFAVLVCCSTILFSIFFYSFLYLLNVMFTWKKCINRLAPLNSPFSLVVSGQLFHNILRWIYQV